ncbi:hypothetical protein ACWEFJ_27835, partial [Actinosynnema sp. NPDC004786]
NSSLEIADLQETKMPGAWEFIEAMVIGRAVRPLTSKPSTTLPMATAGHTDGTKHDVDCDC